MKLFLYLDRETWVHRLDPRSKLVSTLILFVLCLCFNHPVYVGTIALGTLGIALSSEALKNFGRFRHVLILLFLFSALLWPFFIEGPTLLWSWKFLQVSRESLLYGLAMGIRLTTFVSIGLIFLSTTRNEELTNGLIRLGIPYPMAFALSTALRLVPTFAGAGATILQAQISRGLDTESGTVFRRVGKFIPQAVPLFIYAVRHTHLLAMALESKGFSPESERTFYYEPKMKKGDYGALALLLALLIFSLYLRVGLGLGVVVSGRL